MNHKAWPIAVTLVTVLALGACSSSRFGSYGSPAPVAAAPMPEPVEPVPSGPVMAEPLPPLEGPGAVGPVGSAPLPGGIASPGMGNDIAALGFYRFDFSVTNLTPVPEPSALAALGVGAIGLLRRRKRA